MYVCNAQVACKALEKEHAIGEKLRRFPLKPGGFLSSLSAVAWPSCVR